MRFRTPGARWGPDAAPGGPGVEPDAVPAVQEHIDEIKRELREKTPLLGVWGTLADLYALKASIEARANEGAAGAGSACPDALDESMGEYVAGYTDYQRGSLDEAEAHLVASIDRLGWNVLARMTLGNLFFIKGNHEKAKAAFLAALPYCEGAAASEILTNMGMNAFKAGDVTAAEKHLTLAVELDPANAYALNNLGLVSETESDLDAAITWHIKAVEAKPSDEELWYNLGTVLGKAGDKAGRLYCFMQAEERGFSELKELVEDLVAQGIKPADPRIKGR